MKKVERNLKQLDDLPPRVVIFDILTFLEISAPPNNEKDLDMYGYFEKDRLRNVWFVFRSIKFCTLSTDNFSKIVDIQRVYHMNFDVGSSELLKLVAANSDKFTSLNSIKIRSWNDLEMVVPSSLFSKKKSFSKLKKMEIEVGETDLGVLKQLNSFHCSQIEVFCFELDCNSNTPLTKLFDHSGLFKSLVNVRRVSLARVSFNGNGSFELPNVEDLSIHSCYNVRIVSTLMKLRKISLSSIERDTVYDLCGRVQAQELTLSDLYDVDLGKILYPSSSSVQRLHRLEVRNVRNCIVISKSLKRPPLYFGKNLETLKIQDSLVSEDDLMKVLPKLKNLRFYTENVCLVVDSGFNVTKKWPLFDTLRILSFPFMSGDTFKIVDTIFRINTFSNLEELELKGGEVLTGVTCAGWAKFPRLKKLKLEGFRVVSDSFFTSENTFTETLESLEIISSDLSSTVEGSWEEMMRIRSLKNLRFRSSRLSRRILEYFKDEQLPPHMVVVIESCSDFVGEKWSFFRVNSQMELEKPFFEY